MSGGDGPERFLDRRLGFVPQRCAVDKHVFSSSREHGHSLTLILAMKRFHEPPALEDFDVSANGRTVPRG